MNDIGQIVTAIQGNPIKREILGVEENNYVRVCPTFYTDF
jgi:hypothetical protein